MIDLSVIIPARNEMFLKNTVENVLSNMRGNTEIIVIMDGSHDGTPLSTHQKLKIIFKNKPVGQRAATNEGAKLSKAKFIMKLDAHCAVDEGFDVKLMADCKYDWTVVPRMYNLHAFDWQCLKCGQRWYQGQTPAYCHKNGEKKEKNPNCDNITDFKRVLVWKPRLNRFSDFMRFERNNLRFQYWGALKFREKSKGDIADTMSLIGACWFIHRQRFWDLDGLDEKHGSWGQMGTEIACKTWLSGGRLVVNKKTWFSHMFRTQGGDFGFPFPLSNKDVRKARSYSENLWLYNKWHKQKYKLNWLIEKFRPVYGWHEGEGSKEIIYYTDNKLNVKIAKACQRLLEKSTYPIISVSLKPMPHFGHNIHLNLKPSYLTMAKQILTGLEYSKANMVFLAEHDVLYHPSHFDFIPPKKDVYYYNTNVWRVRLQDKHCLYCDDLRQLSGLVAYRETLVKHFRERVRRIEKEGYSTLMGFEPGTHNRKERIDNLPAKNYQSKYPILDIRHAKNLTPSRWKKEQFRNKVYTKGWTEKQLHEIPGWYF